jgi:hypothetical protein
MRGQDLCVDTMVKRRSEHAFWLAHIPGYSEWPRWFQQKFDRSADPAGDRGAVVGEFLRSGGRQRLEDAGGLPICLETQLFLIALLSQPVE